MKTTFLTLFSMIVLSANAQTIARTIDAKTTQKLKNSKWNKWAKVSKDTAIYPLFFGPNSSCDVSQNPTIAMQNDTIIVWGNVPYHTDCKKDYALPPQIFIKIDIKKHPDYAKIPVIYKQNTIESYTGMQDDLQEWENQVYYKSAQVETYSYEKHRKAIENFINNFKFKDTKLSDLKALLLNTDKVEGLPYDYMDMSIITLNLLGENLGIRLTYTIAEPHIITNAETIIGDPSNNFKSTNCK